ncbi:MAG: pyruvate:ferredoxin (flavodoxin) oxidoreductase, partial [Oscillospiraceae bacterium]|nr:pyruvate:ferredoxin (flavodoxin) oxidoreductase [Oscillospiraceae bacterium]
PLVNTERLRAFRRSALNPEHPVTRGTTVNPDIFFQCREGANERYDAVPDRVQHYLDELGRLSGRHYRLFDYYGAPDAERVVVAMGSVTETMRETVDYLSARGEKVGMISVHLYRPFSAKHFLAVLPPSVKAIAALDRTKEHGAMGEPLYQDLCSVLRGRSDLRVVGGRYGLASKDTTPGQILSVFENLRQAEPKDSFTIGINDDVGLTSLPAVEEPRLPDEGMTRCKFWGLGSDGTVGANKNSIRIIGENTGLYTQAYFVYDSKKSGGLTQSHLRFGPQPIRKPYLVSEADFVACHNVSYLTKYDLVKDLRDGGVFLLNCGFDADGLEKHLPAAMKRQLAAKHARFYTVDATRIAREIGLGNRSNTILQAAFFKLADIIPMDTAMEAMKKAIYDSYYVKRGQAVVDMNCLALERGVSDLVRVEIPDSWADAREEAPPADDKIPAFVRDVVEPMNRLEGDALPVSVFKKYGNIDGTWPAGMTRFEKRGTAVEVPVWDSMKCLQCNQCSLVCPHAAIRPFLLDDAEKAAAPAGFDTVPAKGIRSAYAYRLQVSPYDCAGCGSCVNVCPAKEKALSLAPLESQLGESANWDFAVDAVTVKKDAASDKNVKSSQFFRPYFEFSGACAGCGETPYIKLVTQLFGDRMYVANASGCSTAYGGSTPSTPYCAGPDGRGPAWAMSLFEDNAEYACGFLLGQSAVREQLIDCVTKLRDLGVAPDACAEWLAKRDDPDASRAVSEALLAALDAQVPADGDAPDCIGFIRGNAEYLSRKSVWAFGGDGWAYDIGYGGLDHVLASGRNINVLVLDTEVYSNTGGQSSKATPTGAVAKFAAGGKRTRKKDLGSMFMSYGYVYVAQVAMGADPEQTLRAIREAEAYDGPSIVICYCPCIEHGLKCGMGLSQQEEKKAVACGYWTLYRYDPRLSGQGKNPFQLDSKAPTEDLLGFLRGENRYTALELSFPKTAEELFAKAEKDGAERWAQYAQRAKP